MATTTIGEMTTEEEMTLLRRLRAEWGGVVGRDGCDAGKDDDDDDDDDG